MMRNGGNRCGFPRESGAAEESRTLDLNLGKVALYQLSYCRDELEIIAFSGCRFNREADRKAGGIGGTSDDRPFIRAPRKWIGARPESSALRRR